MKKMIVITGVDYLNGDEFLQSFFQKICFDFKVRWPGKKEDIFDLTGVEYIVIYIDENSQKGIMCASDKKSLKFQKSKVDKTIFVNINDFLLNYVFFGTFLGK